jgi:hypothetical protein
MRSLLSALLLAAFCLLSFSSVNAAEPTKPEASAALAAVEPVAQPIVPAIQHVDQTRCRPSQPAAPNQPAVVEPPKFDMAGAEATAGPEVPVGVTAGLAALASLVAGGAGVAVQWKATHRAV